jgi:hypothetical protein
MIAPLKAAWPMMFVYQIVEKIAADLVAEGSAVVAAVSEAFASEAAVGKESVVDFVIVAVAVAVGEQLAAYLTFASDNQEIYSVHWNSGQ